MIHGDGIQELERLEALSTLRLLDTPPEERFDRITRLAAAHFGVPIALVSLIDERRQWFKSCLGLEVSETAREIAFCEHAIQQSDTFIIEDATLDDRFAANPLVTGAPGIRFYAGHPITAPNGHRLGTLCVIDTKPRKFGNQEASLLRDYAHVVEEEIGKTAMAHGSATRQLALRESEVRFEATFEQAAVGMAHVALDGTFLRVNQTICDILGYPAEEMSTLTFQQLTFPEDLARDLELIDELITGKRSSYAMEKRYIRKSGGVVWARLTVSLTHTPDQHPQYFIAVIENIQARKEAEWTLQKLKNELEQRVDERTRLLQAANADLALEILQRRNVETSLRASELRTRMIIEGSLDAYIGLNEEGQVTAWNAAAENIFGWQAHEVLGKDLSASILPPEHAAAHEAGFKRYLATGEASVLGRRIELVARTRDGQRLPVETTISAYELDGTTFFGAFLHNISERKEAAQLLERERQLLNAVLETIDIGVVACGEAGQLTFFNRAARELHGADAAPVGADQWAQRYDLFAADGVRKLETDEIPLARALRGESVTDIGMVIAPAGKLARYVLATGRRLVGQNGISLGAVVAMKDVTRLKELERRHAEGEARLQAIAQNLPALIGHISKDERFLFLNTQAAMLFGKASDELVGHSVREAYGEHQYRKVAGHIAKALAGERVAFEDDVIVDGKHKHYQAVYIPDINALGQVQGFYAMAYDITRRKVSELRQAESEKRLRMITDNLPALIAYIDQQERYQFANSTYRTWFGKSPTDIPGSTVSDFVGEAAYQHLKPYLNRALDGERVTFDKTSTGLTGRQHFVEATYIPDVDEQGCVHGVYSMVMDVTQRTLMEQNLYRQATTDSLTGLPNRSELVSRLEQAVLRSRRSNDELALLFLDIDGFKAINDTLGHHAGDEVLRDFGKRLVGLVRRTDTVGRWAGDEFIIILESPNMTSETACTLANKVLRAMTEPFDCANQKRLLGTSIGIAMFSREQELPGQLISRADAAMYRAKHGGKNCYVLDH